MNSAVKLYRQTFSRCLHCSRKERKRLLAQFDKALVPFLEEYPAPSENDLEYAFGSPAQLANAYLAPGKNRVPLRRQAVRRMSFALAAMLFCILFAFAARTLNRATNTAEAQETAPPQNAAMLTAG